MLLLNRCGWGLVGVVLLSAALLSGCQSRSRLIPPSGPITTLNVMTVPVALNLDNVSGPDGFSAKVYASAPDNPKAVPIKDGKLEVLIFNGTFFGKTNVPTPLRVWSFTADQLKAAQFEASLGVGYEFTLLWGASRPSEPLISVAARYTAPNGGIVTSRPSSVAVVGK